MNFAEFTINELTEFTITWYYHLLLPLPVSALQLATLPYNLKIVEIVNFCMVYILLKWKLQKCW